MGWITILLILSPEILIVKRYGSREPLRITGSESKATLKTQKKALSMTQSINKFFLVPIDGSPQSLNAIDYLGHLFSAVQTIQIDLLYVVSAISPILVEESRFNRKTAAMLQKMEKKNMAFARSALEQGALRLKQMGFEEQRINTTILAQIAGVATDICERAEQKSADALVMSSRGRSRLESYFMGATATKVIDASKRCPAWIVLGKVAQTGFLIAVDRSEEALRAVDHAGFILADTQHPITLFYSQRKLTSFLPREVVDEAPDLETIWQDRVGKTIAPVMETARQILIDAGVADSRITVRVTEGTRSPAADIIKTASQLDCGTIVMGRRGTSGQSMFNMGSVSRKVVDGSDDMAIWIVP